MLSFEIAVTYVIVQMIGALAAGLLVAWLWGPLVTIGASHPGSGYAYSVAVIAEVVLTFLVIIVVLATAQQEAVIGKESALAIGFTIAACGFFGGPISGASMNPARSIGPQIVCGQYGLIWIYALGPCAGAALAVAVAALIFGSPDQGARKAAQG